MDNYAVIGCPIKHSLSPQIHAAFAQQTKQNMHYTAIEAPLGEFEATLKAFKATGGKGVNVTLPFKEQAYALANTHSALAKLAGAANTLVFLKNNEIYADNTDGPGLIQDLTHNHHYSLQQKSILLLGAGGAARGVLGALITQAPARIWIANRTPEKAIALAEEHTLGADILGTGLDDIEKTPFDLVLNATSASITGDVPTLPFEIIGPNTWCYDLFYAKHPTAFLQWAKKHAAEKRIDGLGMLVEQAASAFYLWRGVYPQTQPVIQTLKASLRTS